MWENGIDPGPIFDWPLCRFVAVFGIGDGETKVTDADDFRARRNKVRAAAGLPLIPEPRGG